LLYLSRSSSMARLVTTNRLARSAAGRFVAGQTVEEAIAYVRAINGNGLEATMDRLGENVTSAKDAEDCAAAYVDMLAQIRAAGVRSTVSVKLTSLGLDIGTPVALDMLSRVAQAAGGAQRVGVTIDMEGSPYTQRTLDIFHQAHRDFPHVGTVLQAMLYRSEQDVERLIEVGAHLRLCKGAYLEPASIAYPDKRDTDRAYVRIAERMLSPEARANGAYLGVATHDEAIIAWTKRHVEEQGIGRDAFEFQMLNGVRRDLQARLVREGYQVRVYVPYGTMWYPYFMRRLAERPENVGFMVRHVVGEFVARK
jgi:proline dehydrogenase